MLNRKLESHGSTSKVYVPFAWYFREFLNHSLNSVSILRQPSINLVQMSDDHWYVGLMNKLNMIHPAQIIVPQTIFDAKPETADGKLMKYLREQFPHFSVIKIPRRNFSDTAGLELINKYVSKKFSHVIQSNASKYYAMSAVAGLMKYLLHSAHVSFRENSLKLEFGTKYGHLLMGMCCAVSAYVSGRTDAALSPFQTSKRPTHWNC